MAVSEEAQALYGQMLKKELHMWTQAELELAMVSVGGAQLVDLIQELLDRHLIKLMYSDGVLVYQAVAESEAAQIRNMTGDEAIVYGYVQAAGREGIWTKTIRIKSNLHQHVVNRCLKSLETKRFIKSVKSVKFPTRKIVMLYSLQPSTDVTGGPWFTDTELDSEFIATLTKLVWQYVAHKTFPGALEAMEQKPAEHLSQRTHVPTFNDYPRLADIHDFVSQSGVSTVELGMSDISSLCEVLVYDDRVEQLPSGQFRAKWHSLLDEKGAAVHVPILPSPF